MPNDKFYFEETAPQEVQLKDFPIIDVEGLAKIVDADLGVGSVKSEIIVRTVVDAVKGVLSKGAGVAFDKFFQIVPVKVTEEVRYHPAHLILMTVTPAHKEFRVRMADAFQKRAFNNPDVFYTVRGTNKHMTYHEASALEDKIPKSKVNWSRKKVALR